MPRGNHGRDLRQSPGRGLKPHRLRRQLEARPGSAGEAPQSTTRRPNPLKYSIGRLVVGGSFTALIAALSDEGPKSGLQLQSVKDWPGVVYLSGAAFGRSRQMSRLRQHHPAYAAVTNTNDFYARLREEGILDVASTQAPITVESKPAFRLYTSAGSSPEGGALRVGVAFQAPETLRQERALVLARLGVAALRPDGELPYGTKQGARVEVGVMSFDAAQPTASQLQALAEIGRAALPSSLTLGPLALYYNSSHQVPAAG